MSEEDRVTESDERADDGQSQIETVAAGPAAEGPAVAETAMGDLPRNEIDELDDLDGRPIAEHAEVYERLHGRLQSALAEIDGA